MFVLLLALGIGIAGATAADFGNAFLTYQQGDYDRAYKAFSLLAEQGDPDSQFMLGDLYAQGEGTEKNPVQAYRWYELAARQGTSGAAEARDQIAGSMTTAQIEEARLLADHWQATESPAETTAMAAPDPEPPPAAETTQPSGGFFSNLARGTTGMFGGRQAQAPQTVTATMGIRGISAEELATSSPNPTALAQMESLRVSPSEANGFAQHAQLSPQALDYMSADQPPAAAGSTGTRSRSPIGPR